MNCQGNPPRPDEWQAFPDPDAILALAPESRERYFVVPEIAQPGQEGQ
jgi:Asp-tRNA(Asn)/Glu-tRNA(Gln) amidotransferase C subunit